MTEYYYQSPIGILQLKASKKGLVSCIIVEEFYKSDLTDFFKQVIHELELYFAGTLKRFTISLDIDCSVFSKKVYEALQKSSYGTLISYKQLGQEVDSKAYQAIGSAMNKNDLLIFIPCHRVINSSGDMSKFRYGSEKKLFLIDLEKRTQ